MKLDNVKINFLGDSITEGSGASEPSKCYVSQVAKITGADCRNYGIGGSRIARQQNCTFEQRQDRDYCMRVEEMDADADIVAVFGGTNDFGHGNAPFGEFSDRTVNTFYGALHILFTSLLEKYTTSKIVVFTPFHRCTEDNLNPDTKLPLKPYVEAIREVAEYYSLPILDLYKESGIQPNVPIIKHTYMPDGLHPNDLGHRLLAEKVVAFLKQL